MLNAKAGIWVIDSGATYHICSVKEEFINLDLTWCEKVTVTNGNVLYSAGIGSCKTKFLNHNGAQTVITVDDVLYIPSFKGNLLSVKRLSAAGFKVLFYGSNFEILDKKKIIRLASRIVLTICINSKHKVVKMSRFLFSVSIGVNIFTIKYLATGI